MMCSVKDTIMQSELNSTMTVTQEEIRMAQQTYGYWVQQKIEAEKRIEALRVFLENVKAKTNDWDYVR